MQQTDKLVIPIFAINAILSLLGFVLSMAHFGAPHVWLHPITGAVWTILLFTQMVLANKQNPNHKMVGRLALVVLGVSIYASLSGLSMRIGEESVPFPNSVIFVFIVTGVVTIVYAAMGIGFALK
ncbi:MAG: hypothetical protein V2I33_02235 [Kangiellaceae bacterium]|jgi:hypothetical protein|nr:hypothetical protein [Kangiellaceae bacterium]